MLEKEWKNYKVHINDKKYGVYYDERVPSSELILMRFVDESSRYKKFKEWLEIKWYLFNKKYLSKHKSK